MLGVVNTIKQKIHRSGRRPLQTSQRIHRAFSSSSDDNDVVDNGAFILPEHEIQPILNDFWDMYKLTYNNDSFFSFFNRMIVTRMLQVAQEVTFNHDDSWPYVPYKVDQWSVKNFLNGSSHALSNYLELTNPYLIKTYGEDSNCEVKDFEVGTQITDENRAALRGMVIPPLVEGEGEEVGESRDGDIEIYDVLKDTEEGLIKVQLYQLYLRYIKTYHENLSTHIREGTLSAHIEEQLQELGESKTIREDLNFYDNQDKLLEDFLADETDSFGIDSYWELKGIKGVDAFTMLAIPDDIYNILGLKPQHSANPTMMRTASDRLTKFYTDRHLYVSVKVKYNYNFVHPSNEFCSTNQDIDVLWLGTLRGDDPDVSQWKIAKVSFDNYNHAGHAGSISIDEAWGSMLQQRQKEFES